MSENNIDAPDEIVALRADVNSLAALIANLAASLHAAGSDLDNASSALLEIERDANAIGNR